MKKLALLLAAASLIGAGPCFAKGKIQNEDVKTLTELTNAGGTAAQLINDTKIYVTANSLNKQLSAAITAGDLSGSVNQPFDLENLSVVSSVASNAATFSLKTSDGSTTPSGSAVVKVAFRNSTLATAGYTLVSVTASTTVVAPSGATLGTVSGQPQYVYVYLINNAGTGELAVAGNQEFDEGTRYSTTAIGAGSTDGHTLYSTTARSNVAVRLIGRLLFNETTAGTWATNSTETSGLPLTANKKSRCQVSVDTSTSNGSTNTAIPIFTTTRVNIGTCMTYSTSSTAGNLVTINEDGLYLVYGSNGTQGAGPQTQVAITLNDLDMTQNAYSSAIDHVLCRSINLSTNSSGVMSCSNLRYLRAGDLIRHHSGPSYTPDNSTFIAFSVTQVSN